METESATAPTEPRGAAPSGTVSATATCCPDVATFDGSRAPDRVRGFDARTNLVNNRDSEEYWLPPTKAKAAPSDRYTQDGAAWASVGLNETTELEIEFEGQSGNGCLLNCSFEPAPGGIVALLDQKVAANRAAFRLRGLAEGETTIKVMCNGAELGWVHVVCYAPIKVNAVVGWVNSEITLPVSYNSRALETLLNRVYRQALIRFSVVDFGEINLRGDAALLGTVSRYHDSIPEDGYGEFVDGYGEIVGDALLAGKVGVGILAQSLTPFIASRLAGYGGYLPLVYFSHAERLPLANGSVPKVGSGPCFSYKDFSDATESGYGIEDTYAILAHEAGHAFGLYHPHASECTELPEHLRHSCGQPVLDELETNTEPAIITAGKPVTVSRNSEGIMARDPLNLMGYWPVFREQLFIRKGQWDLCRSGALKYRAK